MERDFQQHALPARSQQHILVFQDFVDEFGGSFFQHFLLYIHFKVINHERMLSEFYPKYSIEAPR